MATTHQIALDERRDVKRDAIMSAIKVCSTLSISTLMVAFILFAAAQPDSFWPPDANIGLTTTWNPSFLALLQWVLVFGSLVSGIGLIANSRRLKRRSDWLRLNFVLLWTISILGVSTYLIF